MLTGEASLEASVRAIRGGIYQFLSKPVEPEDLRRVISAALGSNLVSFALRRSAP